MGRYIFRLPDIGEGIAEAEIVAWHVKLGDRIEEDARLADVMTDKATVELESPVTCWPSDRRWWCWRWKAAKRKKRRRGNPVFRRQTRLYPRQCSPQQSLPQVLKSLLRQPSARGPAVWALIWRKCARHQMAASVMQTLTHT
jgi:hypothetical protein